MRSRAIRTGAWLWALTPLALVVELVAAAVSRAPYSLAHNTISDLGATRCTTIGYPSQEVEVCSPAHLAVNASFVLLGLAMAVGAVLLRRAMPRGRLTRAATVAWVVTGVSSIGSGLTPLDLALELHALVSIPAIVAGGVAMALTGAGLAARDRRWRVLVVAGVLAAVVGAVMVLRLEVEWGGLLERVAIWPSYLAMPLVARWYLQDAPGRA